MFRKIRRAEPGRDEEEATLIAAMARHRLRGWTMRPEIILPAFVAFFGILSLVMENFSFESALSAPLVYAIYLVWMRGVYKRAYRNNIEFLEGKPASDV
jgi:drug/metabolite transporter (DMT)-like permease